MGSGYQERDKNLYDYKIYQMGNYQIRGPKIDLTKPYVCCVGAGQTFGCFTSTPFPSLLSQRLGVQVLNLGFGGVGPLYFLDRKDLIDRINGAKVAIIQVMSGRSEGNSLFDCRGENQGFHQGILKTPLQFWEEIITRQDLQILIDETKDRYVCHFCSLLDRIEKPTILLWFSKRMPEYRPSRNGAWGLWGDYPQFIDQVTLDRIKPRADRYVECVSVKGMPQRLSQPVADHFLSKYYPEHPLAGISQTYNHYYPSPEMHEDAARLLFRDCLELMMVPML